MGDVRYLTAGMVLLLACFHIWEGGVGLQAGLFTAEVK